MSNGCAEQSVGCMLCLLPPLTIVLLLHFGVGSIGAILFSLIVAAIVLPVANRIQNVNDVGRDDL